MLRAESKESLESGELPAFPLPQGWTGLMKHRGAGTVPKSETPRGPQPENDTEGTGEVSYTAAPGSPHPTVLSAGVSSVGTNFRQFGEISSCQNGASHQSPREAAEGAPRKGGTEGSGSSAAVSLFPNSPPGISVTVLGHAARRDRGTPGTPAAPRLRDSRPSAPPRERASERAPARLPRRPPAPLTCRSAPRREPGLRPPEPSVRASPALP